jgi:hypothetical protein
MGYRTLVRRFRLSWGLWPVMFLCWPVLVPAQERSVFTYADADKSKGCFICVSGNAWIQLTGGGETLTFQESARKRDHIELLDASRGGTGVRLFARSSQWNREKETQGKWVPFRTGSWTTVADLRPDFQKYGLKPRLQGERGTCSVFTTVGALEFGLSRKLHKSTILSVEFMNWASNQVADNTADGSFFADCLDGIRQYGLCPDAMMRYQATPDPNRKPSPMALKNAEVLLPEFTDSLQVHWIMPPGNGDPGLTDRQFAEVKATLARGYPVAFGSGHSILLVGYQDRANRPGGGEFFVKDSQRPEFTTYSYEHVKTKPYDVFWVEFGKRFLVDRNQWKYRTGIFKAVDKGNWIEFPDNGGKYNFKEVARKADYVELYEQERQLTLRIYGATYSKMFYKTPKMRNWALMYDGNWVAA